MADESVSNLLLPFDPVAERENVAMERARQEALFLLQQQACYQRFAVNACLFEAKRTRRSAIDEMRRREILLNELDRQTQAIDALNRIQDKLSPQRQQQAADQAVQAQQDALARQARNNEKNAARSSPQSVATQGLSSKATNTLSDADENERAFEAKLAQARQRKLDLVKRLRQQNKGASSLPVPY